MIIGIDIRLLGKGVKSGIEEYTENLLAYLIPLNPTIKFKLFYSSFSNKLPEYDWLKYPNVELFRYRFPNKLLFFSSSFLNTPKLDQLMGGVDVFFSPHFFITALSSACKRVVTFHDLSYIHFPEFFSWRKNIWHNFEMRPIWQSHFSDKIIAVSESTKNDLVNLYHVDPAKVQVIYSGISSDIARPSDENLKEFKIKNKLPDEFILFLGKFEPRKNISGIIGAFDILKRNTNFSNLKLILVGSRGWLYKNIFEDIEKSKYRDSIILKDYVSDDERSFYYSLASVFVYPSFFEGFGFPPLEAMKCGTPVIASRSSAIPETVGNSAILVDPHNLNELSDAIEIVLENKTIREKLIAGGFKKTKSFNWRDTAEKTLGCLLK